MKQSISKQQWEELTEEQIGKLRKFCQTLNEYIDGRCPSTMMDIGTMIEYLGDDLWSITLGRRDNTNGYDVVVGDKNFFTKELADALWSACKYKLKT